MNKPASTTTRSISVDALNQSDSESDLSHQHTGSLTRTNRLMRATISSQNKAIPTIVKTNPSGARKRMTSSYSTMSLNQVGDNEDSSSEEGKNNPVGRSRNVNQDRSNAALMGPPPRRTSNTLGRSGSERDLSHFQRMSQRPGTKIQRSNSGYIKTVSGPDGNTPEFHTKDGGNTVDVSSAPLSQQLISSITDQLMRAIDSVVQLHKRLEIEAVNQSDHDVLLTDLHGAVEEAQKSLRLVEPISDINVANKIQEVLTKSNDPRGNIESFFSQYSDVIASLVQQKMSNENKN
uniref:Uncharacterized protein n=2 Tax=Clastoptera arizonana TaxID=38151 RepID=A0A1B6CSN8_9HEMI